MGLSREEILAIAEMVADKTLNQYRPPEDVSVALLQSMLEEKVAADWYRKRAKFAQEHGRLDLKDLWEHIAVEEDVHYDEFKAALPKEKHNLYVEAVLPAKMKEELDRAKREGSQYA
jgi:rubrerythrin